MTKQILTAPQKKWLTALESGDYKQTKYRLYNGKGFCCLGVACDLFKDYPSVRGRWGEKDDEGAVEFIDKSCGGTGNSTTATPAVRRLLKLRGDQGEALAHNHTMLVTLNDWGRRFKTIAKIIRANPEQYFKT